MATQPQPRGSSPKTPTRRPRFMRASATEPSVATSNASRKDLASLHCPSGRAATLLNRVASYSTAQHDLALGRRSPCSSPSQSPQSAGGGRKEPFEIVISQSGNYFSFPSFEDFQEYLEKEDRMEHVGTPKV